MAQTVPIAGKSCCKLEQWSITTLLGHLLSLQDARSLAVWRAAAIEMVSAWLFVFLSIIVSVVSNYHGFSNPILVIALADFIILSLIIRAATPSSDGHLNPAISLCALFSGKYSPARALMYILSQCAGAVFGAICAKGILLSDEVDASLLGGCTVTKNVIVDGLAITQGLEDNQAFVAEFTFSFVLMWITFCVAMDKRQFQETGLRFFPFLIGATVGLNIFISGSIAPGYSGASMNPARCVGPALVYGGRELQGKLWIFILAPTIAALSAALLYNVVPPNHVEIYSQKEDIFHQVIKYKRRPSELEDMPSQVSMENVV